MAMPQWGQQMFYEPPTKKSNIGLNIALVVGVIFLLAAIGVGIYFATRSDESESGASDSEGGGSGGGTGGGTSGGGTGGSTSGGTGGGGTSGSGAGGGTSGSGTGADSTAATAKQLSTPIYFLSKACPTGASKKTQTGLISTNFNSNFTTGHAKLNPDGIHFWTHPDLCEYKSLEKLSDQTLGMCASDPGGAEQLGHLLYNEKSKDFDPYGNGGGTLAGTVYNWRHPFVCKVKDNQTSACGFAPLKCPANYEDKGQAGVLVPTGGSFGGKGAAYNSVYDWAHPRLCCPKG